MESRSGPHSPCPESRTRSIRRTGGLRRRHATDIRQHGLWSTRRINNKSYFIKITHLLQNHTRTTSFSIPRLSARSEISSDVGFGFCKNAFSSATRTLVSIEVRFFLRLPIASGVVKGLFNELGLLTELSASNNHFCSNGFSLHIFLKDRFRASNLEIVVWEKSFPYSFPMASPTSPCVKPEREVNMEPLHFQFSLSLL